MQHTAQLDKREIIDRFLQRGVLLSRDVFDRAADLHAVEEILEEENLGELLFLNRDIISLLDKRIFDINWQELEQARSAAEKAGNDHLYRKFLECAATGQSIEQCEKTISHEGVKVVFSSDKPITKKEVADFVGYYNARFKAIGALLRNRQELTGLTSVARVLNKRDRETVSLIGLVAEKSVTANNNVMLTLEDASGQIKVLVSKKKQEVYEQGRDITLDECIGVTGVCGDKIVFCTGIVQPDIPFNKELKKSPVEEYAIFLSDLHVGSIDFLDEKFNKFLRWLNGEIGTEEHRKMIEKTKYLFIAGDLVDGVGIYPNQDSELVIKDIYRQYELCAELLAKIPRHINIIMCPGNHDSVRLSEPQPRFDMDFARPLYTLPNALIVSNPSVVNIAARDGFSGFDVLMYHGYSFDYFISNIDSIRNNGGYDRADLVMKFLLQRRHLAPTHTATLYVPDREEDQLFISRVPDFFMSGHIHKSSVASYRNVSMICGSCWQSTTSFQIKVGHHPEPAQVPIVNLQTRQTRILRF